MGKQYFVINEINLVNRPKRLLKAKPRILSVVNNNKQEGGQYSQATFVPREDSLARLAKFAQAGRFDYEIPNSEEQKLRYKQKIVEGYYKSDFDRVKGVPHFGDKLEGSNTLVQLNRELYQLTQTAERDAAKIRDQKEQIVKIRRVNKTHNEYQPDDKDMLWHIYRPPIKTNNTTKEQHDKQLIDINENSVNNLKKKKADNKLRTSKISLGNCFSVKPKEIGLDIINTINEFERCKTQKIAKIFN